MTTTRLDLPEAGQLVAGTWSVPTGVLDLELEDSFLGTTLGKAAESDADSVERAAAAAWAAYESGTWLDLGPEGRAEVLEAVADALEPELGRLCALESFATGVPIGQTSIVGVIVPGAFRLAAGMLRAGVLSETFTSDGGNQIEVHRLPLGPGAVPGAVERSGADGRPQGRQRAGRRGADHPQAERVRAVRHHRAGPRHRPGAGRQGRRPGVFQLVQGGSSVGGRLVRDPRVRAVSFTGGAAGGRAVAAACAEDFTALQLELGGNNPLVVMPDADPAAAARAAVDLLTTLNGQWCRALGRLVVPQEMADEVVKLATERLAALHVGDPLDPETDLGPIVHSGHLARLRDDIAMREAVGGVAHTSTVVPDGPGSFLAPTLLTGVPSEAAVEEMFGPVATVHTYETEAEALALANGTPFGLEGYVIGTDTDRALALARRSAPVRSRSTARRS